MNIDFYFSLEEKISPGEVKKQLTSISEEMMYLAKHFPDSYRKLENSQRLNMFLSITFILIPIYEELTVHKGGFIYTFVHPNV